MIIITMVNFEKISTLSPIPWGKNMLLTKLPDIRNHLTNQIFQQITTEIHYLGAWSEGRRTQDQNQRAKISICSRTDEDQ